MENIEKETITFSFGKNWRDFVDHMSDEAVQGARSDIEEWFGQENVSGKTVLDIGCGSGIHSLCFHMLGAKEIVSLDVDPHSVSTTKLLWERAGKPSNWTVLQGSILDRDFVDQLGQHELVYSWGVLHHTGAMWQALENACTRVQQGGRFWIALYVKGPTYPEHLALKQRYNRHPWWRKKIMVWRYIYHYYMAPRWRAGLNPFGWNTTSTRGMNVYRDVIDWLGGLPYEVASKEEVVSFCGERGFTIEKILETGEQGNNIYLFSRGS
jgi:2-polyprenyl-6-hydroxyphenyl methylase/3-demethylubiquinone-9 3-methyltransferase